MKSLLATAFLALFALSLASTAEACPFSNAGTQEKKVETASS